MKNLSLRQVAYTNFPYYKYSLKYTLDSLERIGAHDIEFYAAYPHFYLGDITPQDIKTTARMLKEHNLHVINLCPENCSYPVNAISTNIHAKTRSIDHYVRALQAANEFETPYCLFFPGWVHFDENQDEGWKRRVETMSYLAGIAETYGVQLLLESAPRCSSILTSTEKQIKMIDEVGSRALTGMIDLSCLFYINETVEGAVEKLGIDRICHVHFHNCAELTPGRYEHRLPMDGVLDLKHALEVLDEAGYKGHFGCEVFAPYEYEPEQAMLEFKKFFEQMDLLPE
ncbi:MAG TPA: sugar phosphate isomerase/epimerase [Candidatus Mediterraneibacter norfolkensis]|nr:sugar phosphate isomerase/epimerase [Candidatus Mediterraneibacter norfolkensis]